MLIDRLTAESCDILLFRSFRMISCRAGKENRFYYDKRNVVNRDKSQLTLLDYRKMVVVNERMENAAGATIALDVSVYRMSVCHALLKSATPFSILDSGSEIRNLLQDGQTECPKQACSDMIPLLQKKNMMKQYA